jgi:molecular chaperone DnaJ
MAKRDYYEVLGATKSASEADLKKAYRKKAMELHPDRNPGDTGAESKFKEVNEAWEVLKDAQKKAAYDQFGHAAFEAGAGAGPGGFRPGQGGADFSSAFSDVFDDLFGDFMGGRRRPGGGSGGGRASRGSDLRFNLTVSLEDAMNGRQAAIQVPGSATCESCSGSGAAGGSEPQTCPTCSGMGKVRAQQGFFTIERSCPTCGGRGQIIKNPCTACGGSGRRERTRSLNVAIPPGVETGTRIRLAGEGEAGLRGGPPGDLYIFVTVADHPIFERDGQNLFCRIPLSMVTAALGGEIEVPTLDGGRTRVRVPEGAQSGKQLRLRGKGLPTLRGGAHGDLFLELAVETPVNLSGRQKELLREFEAEGRDNNPEAKDFLSKVKRFWDGMTG